MSFLSGFRLLDLASVGPAARASRILADYGMDVVKIAPVSARGQKYTEPVYHAYGAGRGTRRIRVDLESGEGKETLWRLARSSDVLVESFRPGVAARIGVGYEQLRAHNPRIIYCSTSGYGQQGPCAQWAGHDINYLAMGGFLATSGRDAAGRPALPGATVADGAGGGMHAALAIIAALVNRLRSDEGAYLDVAITDGVLNLMSLYLDEYLATGVDTGPGTALLTGKYACYGVYATRDGGAVAVGAIETRFFANLCRLLGLEALAASQYDDARQDELKAALAAKFLARDRDEWAALLAGENTCVTPVLGIAEVAVSEQFTARQRFVAAEHPVHGAFRQLGPVLAGSARASAPHRVAAAGATDTDAVLAEAGFEAAEIARLRETGVVE
jgi:alpha-methylacyl-CoA racemase